MATSDQIIIGKVGTLTGKAFAKAPTGELRELQVGDPVFEGELVVAPPGSKVELAFNNGSSYFIRDNESVTLDGMVFGGRVVETTEGALFNGEIERISSAIEEGDSLRNLFQETSGGAGGPIDEGHMFVQLLRIAEAVTPLGFDTRGIVSGQSDEIQSFVQLSRIQEGTSPLDLNTSGIENDQFRDVFSTAGARQFDVPPAIVPLNIAAVLGTGVANLTETNSPLSARGTLSISDIDSSATFNTGTIVGTYGSLTIATNGAWVFTANSAFDELDPGEVKSEVFTVTSSDGTPTTVNIQITGTQDVALLTSAVANLTETNAVLTTGGTLVVSDLDATDATVLPSSAVGAYGSFQINANGVWSYSSNSALNQLNAGQVVSETFTVKTSDGGSSVVTIVLTGTEDVSTLTSATVDLTETNEVLSTGGTLVLSDLDSAAATVVAQSGTHGTYGTFSIDAAGVWNYSTTNALNFLEAGQVVSETFAVNTADGGTSTVTVNITGTSFVTTLNLFASPSASEGGSIIYTASVTNPSDSDLVVTLSNNQSITIAAGSTTGSISVAAPSDDP
nr:retention module-containing protein [Rhodocyclaceae bacterium]